MWTTLWRDIQDKKIGPTKKITLAMNSGFLRKKKF